MYATRIQLIDYGPIENIDISFPFDGEQPKPVVLVGETGAGKSITLSHIVNGLISAQSAAFPENPDVQSGKVFKLRSNAYIRLQRDYYFAQVDYSGDISVREMRIRIRKPHGAPVPSNIEHSDAQVAWSAIQSGESDYFSGPTNDVLDDMKVRDAIRANCVLYFPPNRYEEPAWLNEQHLNTKAEYMNLHHTTGYTDRVITNYSPLRDNQNWLFEVIYDRAAFEMRTQNVDIPVQQNGNTLTVPLPLFLGYSGQSETAYQNALEIVRLVINEGPNIRFGIGRRANRTVSIVRGEQVIVPNIFQLSSGETSLLNIFLSILRDFDLCDAQFVSLGDVKGIVVVDEVDLHLHAIHQYDVLPKLIKLFPNVQFIVTSHSPLFVLGMQREFGVDGFGLYRLPHGDQISPEEFSEFGVAYQAFAETITFSDDVRIAIKESQKSLVFVDGVTDVKYIKRAAELLGKSSTIENVELRPAGGDGQLTKIWNSARVLGADLIPEKVVVLHDCDGNATYADAGNMFRRLVPKQSRNPILKGVENLFSENTLTKAMNDKSAFIDVTPEHPSTLRGESITILEQWVINADEKTNLCDWLCANGDADDFAGFSVIFELLDEIWGARYG